MGSVQKAGKSFFLFAIVSLSTCNTVFNLLFNVVLPQAQGLLTAQVQPLIVPGALPHDTAHTPNRNPSRACAQTPTSAGMATGWERWAGGGDLSQGGVTSSESRRSALGTCSVVPSDFNYKTQTQRQNY